MTLVGPVVIIVVVKPGKLKSVSISLNGQVSMSGGDSCNFVGSHSPPPVEDGKVAVLEEGVNKKIVN